MADTLVYDFTGGVGDSLMVYTDRVVIKHKGVLNFLAMGIKGDKTIYYNNITSVQFKKAGWTAGYIQFSINGGRENVGGVFGAMQDENSIAVSSEKNAEAEEVVNYINRKLAELRNAASAPQSSFSAADELKKFKELLDAGVITQEEFDAKKKQLLGI